MKNKFRLVIFGFVIELTMHKQATIKHDERSPDNWKATHRHRKGGAYRHICDGLLEADKSAAVVYDDKVGNVWIRSKVEFDDGRFTLIDEHLSHPEK